MTFLFFAKNNDLSIQEFTNHEQYLDANSSEINGSLGSYGVLIG